MYVRNSPYIEQICYKENVADGSVQEYTDEKPSTTEQTLESLQVLRRRIKQRGDFDVCEQH